MMGNDPRPHYFHQTNLAETGVTGGGVLYPVLNAVIADYTRYFAANAPIEQLSQSAIADLLARQSAWAGLGGSQVTGYIEGNQVTLLNSGAAVWAPLSGTEAGSDYGGTRSGWVTVPSGTSTHTAAAAWPGTVVPAPPTPPNPPVTQPVSHGQPPAGPPPVIVPPEGNPPSRAPSSHTGRPARRAKKKHRKLTKKQKIAKCIKRNGANRAPKTPRAKHRVAAIRKACRVKYTRPLKKPHKASPRRVHRGA
jgi:hypothetical protein